jgi:hypothetical protein
LCVIGPGPCGSPSIDSVASAGCAVMVISLVVEQPVITSNAASHPPNIMDRMK